MQFVMPSDPFRFGQNSVESTLLAVGLDFCLALLADRRLEVEIGLLAVCVNTIGKELAQPFNSPNTSEDKHVLAKRRCHFTDPVVLFQQHANQMLRSVIETAYRNSSQVMCPIDGRLAN